jgi:hypothetical protein
MRRIGLAGIAASTAAIAVAYLATLLRGAPPAWAAWAVGLGAALMLVAFMGLGAARPGRPARALAPVLLVTFLLLAGGIALALVLPPDTGRDVRLWLGLPPRAAIVLYGIGILPALLLPLGYALTFDRGTLGEEDVERVRRLRREAAPDGPA